MCPAKRFVAKNMLMLQCLTEFSLFFSFENRGLSIIPKHKSRLFSRENVAFITYAIRASQYAKFCDLGIGDDNPVPTTFRRPYFHRLIAYLFS